MFHGEISASLARRLAELRYRIDAARIPSSKLDETLNIASWNIREFGKTSRTDDAIHMIAEIIGQFDLVAVVELRDNLDDLFRVLQILGPYWKFVLNDFDTDRAGNRERFGFVYDERMVRFTGFAAEADPPAARAKLKGGKKGDYTENFSFWRSPYMASFAAGNFDFTIMAVHARWGKSVKERQIELKNLAEWVHKRQKDRTVFDKDIIVVGDFNIPKVDDDLFKAMTSKGLQMPKSLELEMLNRGGGNLNRNAHYDQILHFSKSAKSFTSNGGILDFYCGDHAKLFPNLTKAKFTYQLSDHLPIWVQLDTDIEGVYLDRAIREKRKSVVLSE